MKKIMWITVLCMLAGAALAEQMVLTGVLKFSANRKFYGISECTPEVASTFKAAQFADIDMEQFSSGDQVKMTVDASVRVQNVVDKLLNHAFEISGRVF